MKVTPRKRLIMQIVVKTYTGKYLLAPASLSADNYGVQAATGLPLNDF